MIYEIGTRVKYVSGKHGDWHNNPLWGGEYGKIAGTIVKNDRNSYLPYRVKWDNCETNVYSNEDLEVINVVPDDLFEI